MDNLLETICIYAPHAHWIFFGLLILSGLNIPISEDILLLTAGALANLCLQNHQVWTLYGWIFAGSWISAWQTYWIGRCLGPKLYAWRLFNCIVTPQRIDVLHTYYEKFGIWTFIVGRFFPGGIRNALFITSGLGKMPFSVFIARDGLACLLSTATLFSIGFYFAANYHRIIHTVKEYNLIAFATLSVVLALSTLFWFNKVRVKE